MASQPVETRSPAIPLVLAERRLLPRNSDLATFVFQARNGLEIPPFEAGQHAVLGLPGDEGIDRGYYSIASAPEERPRLEFFVRRVSGGGTSGSLFSLREGGEAFLEEIGGDFTLKHSRRTHLAFVAGGTGLAPFLSMLRHLQAATGSAGGDRPASLSLWHGVRVSSDLGYREELEALQARAPFPFAYVPTVSRPGEDPEFDGARLSRGRVDELLAGILGVPGGGDPRGFQLAPGHSAEALQGLLPPGETDFFVCGPYGPAAIHSRFPPGGRLPR
ncbi:MAG: ferredoxin--NADP reductase [Planctomycetota bacterium]